MTLLQTVCALLLGVSLVSSSTQICQDPDNNSYSIITCGAPGKDGLPGQDGKQGPKGEKGYGGLPGIKGQQGVTGPPGQQGEQGLHGQKGESGDSGFPVLEAIKLQISSLAGHLNSLQSNVAILKKAALFSRGRSVGNKYFVTNGEESNFDGIKLACSKAGGQIATPRNAEESQAVAEIVAKYNKNTYLGITNLELNGTFRYTSGEVIEYSNWYTGEPNNENEVERCVEMYTSGKWNDKRCDEKRLIICEFF